MFKLIQFLFILLLTGLNLAGQIPNAYFLFKSYSTRDGLSSYYSRKIAEDQYGFIWIATQDGLNRFDGRRFIQFSKNTPEKLCGNDVTDIVIDNARNLIWVSTALGGINAIELTTLRIKKNIPIARLSGLNDWITCMTLVKKELWLGTNNGLFIFDTDKNQVTASLPLPGSLNGTNARFNKLIRADEQQVLGLVNENTLLAYNTGNRQIMFQYTAAGQTITNLCPSSGGSMLAASGTGLFRITRDPAGTFSTQQLWSGSPVRAVYTADNSTAWFSATGGLYRIQLATGAATRIKNSSETSNSTFSWEEFINQVFFDSNNHLWLSTFHGIMVSDASNSPFTAHASLNKQTLKIDHPFSISVADSSRYLIHTDAGLIICDRTFSTGEKIYPGTSFYSGTRLGNVSLVFSSEGIKVLQGRSLAPASVLFPELRSVQQREIGTWHPLNDSVLLMCSYAGSEIWKWDRKNKQLDLIPLPLQEAGKTLQVNSICPENSSSLLIAAVSGIFRYSPAGNIISKIALPGISPDVIIYDIFSKNGKYLVGTYGDGIFVYDSLFRFVKQIKTTDGLTNNNIYNFYDLGPDKVLAATNYGATEINTAHLSTKTYFQDDGIVSNNLEYNFHPGGTARRIFIPSIEGLTMVLPEYLERRANKPRVYFEKISIKTGSSDTDTLNTSIQKLVIPADFLQVNITFSGLEFSNPMQLHFLYRVPELSEEWINNEEKNFISLINMSPGTYHLQVQAVTPGGVSSDIKELVLVFMPKWYQTWWFRSLLALSIMGIVYGLYRIRINQLKKEQQIRTRLASDLHDDLGSTMNSVKVYTNLALMEKQADKYLPLIKEGTQDAINGIRDIIWVLDDRKDTIEHLVARVSAFAVPLCEANGISFRADISDNSRDLKLAQAERRNLYMMLKEAVNNAIKYSGCRNLLFTITASRKTALLRLQDDGKGFEPGQAAEGNGLKNMERRAREIRYQLRIQSSPGNGTTIELTRN